MPNWDPEKLSDDELRPWVVDADYESKVSETMSKFDETYSETSLNRNAGSHGDSDLDKFRHDDIMAFGDTVFGVEHDEEKGSDCHRGGAGQVDYLQVHTGDDDDRSAGSDEDQPHFLSCEDCDEDVPLGEDMELLKLTSSMNNLDEERFMKTRAMRLLMQREKKKREDEFRQGGRNVALARSLQRIPSAKYMPTHKTRVYKEWMDAQQDLRRESMKAKSYLLDRPTTAFINSLIDQERDILAESFLKKETLRVSNSEDFAAKTLQIEEQNKQTLKTREFNEQKRRLEKFNRLYPDLRMKIPSSPISSARPTSSSSLHSPAASHVRPATADGALTLRPFPVASGTGTAEGSLELDVGAGVGAGAGAGLDPLSGREGRNSPLRPLTSEEKFRNHQFRKSKSTFADKRCDMTLVLNLKDTSSSYPTSNKDTIPSTRSAIVKYRTPREQMLDSLKVPTKAEEEAAKRKAAKRVKEATKAMNDLQSKASLASGENKHDRFSQSSAPLDKLGITASTGAIGDRPVFQRPPKAKVRELKDLMRTTAGVNSRVFNRGFQSNLPYDAQKERQKASLAAAKTKEVNNLDSTTEALINPGFFEAMGPDRIYLSETSKFHSVDERHAQQLANRERAHITEGDHIRKWALDSLSSGRQLFNSGGGGFHYS